ncbi:MAG: LytR/AlgR family response regulator transcription factor [Verrucomicrobium sp.]|nr:response regulator [Verrucomicrobium sp.]
MIVWRVLIVDDEPLALEHMVRLLRAYDDVDIVGTATEVAEAADLCQKEAPNLLMLDVQLARSTGFDLLPLLQYSPQIVFVTAYDHFALRAFDVNALDYLLKPVTSDRLDMTMAKLKSRLSEQVVDVGATAIFDVGDPVYLQTSKSCRMVQQRDISHLCADGSYTILHLRTGEKVVICRSLTQWESQLPEKVFARLDRSTIINKHHLREIRFVNRDESRLIMKNGDEISLGRTGTLRVKILFGKG